MGIGDVGTPLLRCPDTRGRSRAFALPVADEAKAQRVQRSAGDEGIRAEDIRRAPQTGVCIFVTGEVGSVGTPLLRCPDTRGRVSLRYHRGAGDILAGRRGRRPLQGGRRCGGGRRHAYNACPTGRQGRRDTAPAVSGHLRTVASLCFICRWQRKGSRPYGDA